MKGEAHDQRARESHLVGAGRDADREALGEVVDADGGRDQHAEGQRGSLGLVDDRPAVEARGLRRGGAAAGGRLHGPAPQDRALREGDAEDAEQERSDEQGHAQDHRPRRAAVLGLFHNGLDEAPPLADHVPEQEQQDPGRDGGQEAPRGVGELVEPAQRLV